ncbi:MAG: hypothetical protein ACKN9W_03300 [Methylococcus sp.]
MDIPFIRQENHSADARDHGLAGQLCEIFTILPQHTAKVCGTKTKDSAPTARLRLFIKR